MRANVLRAERAPRVFSPPLTAVEYFAGVGLFRMGLARAGWRVVFANDWDKKKLPMYRAFFPQDAAHYDTESVFRLDAKNVPSATLATCSFPCVDLSLAGKMRGINGDDSSAFWGFLDIVKAHGASAPQIILLENVPGLLTANGGRDMVEMARALNRLDYRCDIFTLNALHFTPQSRLRVFVVAARGDGFPAFDREKLSARGDFLAPKRLLAAIDANPELAGMTLRLPPPPPRMQGGMNEKIIELVAPKSPLWWDEKKLAHHLEMMSVAHRRHVEELRRKKRVAYCAFYRRRRAEGQRAEVRRDDIAGCLRTVVGGSGRQFLVAAGRGKISMRAMTAREYARLQGVPDSFTIDADEKTALSAFGDAVCVPAIEWIAREVLNPLVETLYRRDSLGARRSESNPAARVCVNGA